MHQKFIYYILILCLVLTGNIPPIPNRSFEPNQTLSPRSTYVSLERAQLLIKKMGPKGDLEPHLKGFKRFPLQSPHFEIISTDKELQASLGEFLKQIQTRLHTHFLDQVKPKKGTYQRGVYDYNEQVIKKRDVGKSLRKVLDLRSKVFSKSQPQAEPEKKSKGVLDKVRRKKKKKAGKADSQYEDYLSVLIHLVQVSNLYLKYLETGPEEEELKAFAKEKELESLPREIVVGLFYNETLSQFRFVLSLYQELLKNRDKANVKGNEIIASHCAIMLCHNISDSLETNFGNSSAGIRYLDYAKSIYDDFLPSSKEGVGIITRALNARLAESLSPIKESLPIDGPQVDLFFHLKTLKKRAVVLYNLDRAGEALRIINLIEFIKPKTTADIKVKERILSELKGLKALGLIAEEKFAEAKKIIQTRNDPKELLTPDQFALELAAGLFHYEMGRYVEEQLLEEESASNFYQRAFNRFESRLPDKKTFRPYQLAILATYAAEAKIRLGQYSEAVSILKPFVETETNIYALGVYAQASWMNKNPGEAIWAMESLLKYFPLEIATYEQLTKIYLLMGLPQEAYLAFKLGYQLSGKDKSFFAFLFKKSRAPIETQVQFLILLLKESLMGRALEKSLLEELFPKPQYGIYPKASEEILTLVMASDVLSDPKMKSVQTRAARLLAKVQELEVTRGEAEEIESILEPEIEDILNGEMDFVLEELEKKGLRIKDRKLLFSLRDNSDFNELVEKIEGMNDPKMSGIQLFILSYMIWSNKDNLTDAKRFEGFASQLAENDIPIPTAKELEEYGYTKAPKNLNVHHLYWTISSHMGFELVEEYFFSGQRGNALKYARILKERLLNYANEHSTQLVVRDQSSIGWVYFLRMMFYLVELEPDESKKEEYLDLIHEKLRENEELINNHHSEYVLLARMKYFHFRGEPEKSAEVAKRLIDAMDGKFDFYSIRLACEAFQLFNRPDAVVQLIENYMKRGDLLDQAKFYHLSLLGHNLSALNRPSAALTIFYNALEVYPNNPEIHEALFNILFESYADRRAVKLIDRWIPFLVNSDDIGMLKRVREKVNSLAAEKGSGLATQKESWLSLLDFSIGKIEVETLPEEDQSEEEAPQEDQPEAELPINEPPEEDLPVETVPISLEEAPTEEEPQQEGADVEPEPIPQIKGVADFLTATWEASLAYLNQPAKREKKRTLKTRRTETKKKGKKKGGKKKGRGSRSVYKDPDTGKNLNHAGQIFARCVNYSLQGITDTYASIYPLAAMFLRQKMTIPTELFTSSRRPEETQESYFWTITTDSARLMVESLIRKGDREEALRVGREAVELLYSYYERNQKEIKKEFYYADGWWKLIHLMYLVDSVIDPNEKQAQSLNGISYLEKANQELKNREEILRDKIKEQFYFIKMKVNAALGNRDGAQDAAQQVLSILSSPKKPIDLWFVTSADYYLDNHDRVISLAHKLFTQVEEPNTVFYPIYMALVRSLLAQGREPQALLYLNEVLILEPGNQFTRSQIMSLLAKNEINADTEKFITESFPKVLKSQNREVLKSLVVTLLEIRQKRSTLFHALLAKLMTSSSFPDNLFYEALKEWGGGSKPPSARI